MTWQGQSGNTAFPGTTIRQGIERQAARVTYSADASAPTNGHDVGVVVIGETLPVSWPRSEDQEPIHVGDRPYDPLFPASA